MFRFENLKSELDIVSPTGGMPSTPGHQRTPSGISNISLDSVSSTATLEARPFEDEEVSRFLVITKFLQETLITLSDENDRSFFVWLLFKRFCRNKSFPPKRKTEVG